MKKMFIWLMAFALLPLTSLFAQQNVIWSLPPNYAKFPSNGAAPTINSLPAPQYLPDGVTLNTPDQTTGMTDSCRNILTMPCRM